MRFIVLHGILPWGIVAGVLAVTSGVLAEHLGAVTEGTRSSLTVVATLCLVVWCVLVGWTVGAIQWEFRNIDKTDQVPSRRRRHDSDESG